MLKMAHLWIERESVRNNVSTYNYNLHPDYSLLR